MNRIRTYYIRHVDVVMCHASSQQRENLKSPLYCVNISNVARNSYRFHDSQTHLIDLQCLNFNKSAVYFDYFKPVQFNHNKQRFSLMYLHLKRAASPVSAIFPI